MVRDVSTSPFYARAGGRNVIVSCITSISNMAVVVVQPIFMFVASIFNWTAGFSTKLISFVMTSIRQAVDALWYGYVDGVTTSGIKRTGGLSELVNSFPFIVIASSFLTIGIIKWLMNSKEITPNWFANALRQLSLKDDSGISDNEDRDDEYYDSDDSEPSPQEELRFLNSFDAANPTSRERISKKITKKQGHWPFRSTSKQSPRQEKKQHQRSVKSIQKWWRSRPSSAVQIIEPSRAQQQPLSQQVAKLKSQLAQSEQERAVLQSDVARLQHRLQKAHHDAKTIVSKNQWLEKQQS